jgi:hypothetical protein
MESAIAAGYAQVNAPHEGEIVLLRPEVGLDYYREHDTEVQVSFPVNSPAAAIGLATARRDGQFVIPALSTDGGAIPRNVTIEKGLALVRFEAFSTEEFVQKASLTPARLLGLGNKGQLGEGADADIAIVDPDAAKAEAVIAGGQVIFRDGEVVGRGGDLITTERGAAAVGRQGVGAVTVAPGWLG